MAYFCKSIRQIHDGITRGRDEGSTTFYLPKALVEAFNPLITYVCICSQINHVASSDLDLLKRCAKKVHKSLRNGKLQLVSMIRRGDFSEAKVFRRVNAQDIITLVTDRLARIPSEGQDGFNLLQIYRRYISRLVQSLHVYMIQLDSSYDDRNSKSGWTPMPRHSMQFKRSERNSKL